MTTGAFHRKPKPTEPVSDSDESARISAQSAWFVAAASRIGTSHVDAGTVREDAMRIESIVVNGRPAFVIAVADGVGSASLAWLGARRAADAFVQSIVTACAVDGTESDPIDLVDLVGLVDKASKSALAAVDDAAAGVGSPSRELATTLLGILATETDDGRMSVVAFQAGNGLIATANMADELEPLFDPGDELEDGSIHALTSSHIRAHWQEHIFSTILPEACRGLIIATDGISDDLIPLRRNGPILMRELYGLPQQSESAAASGLSELIAYVRRGSSDDRTLACLLRGEVASVVAAGLHAVSEP